MKYQYVPTYEIVVGDLKSPFYFTDTARMASFMVWATDKCLKIHSVTRAEHSSVVIIDDRTIHPQSETLNVEFYLL